MKGVKTSLARLGATIESVSKNKLAWRWRKYRQAVRFSLVLPLLLLGQGGRAQSYRITDLGALGGSYSEAHGLNSAGVVAGDWDPGGPWVRAFYYQAGTNVDVPTLGGVYGLAWGINASNTVVGESSIVGAYSDIHAFAFQNGNIADLGTLGGTYIGGYSSAHGINTSGEIVGESSLSMLDRNTTHAVLYSTAGKKDLGVLGGNYSSASAINDSGEIVGESAVIAGGATNIHAFLYSNNALRDLGTLGGDYSSANAINNSGVVAGEADLLINGVTNLHAFVWNNGAFIDLGTFGGVSSSALGINSFGHVVGYSYDAYSTSWAFLYDGAKVINLFDQIPANSGWTNLTSADAINDAGQIAGSGLLTNGAYHAFLLKPIQASVAPLVLTSQPLNGEFQLTISGLAGSSYILQSSTNLVDWTDLSTNTLAGTQTNYVDTAVSQFSARFYRTISLP